MAVVGSGSQGVVSRVCKGVVKKTIDTYDDYVRETKMLAYLKGLPCIVEVVSTCTAERSISMQDGGAALHDVRKQFNGEKWPKAHTQIVSAVSHLHARNVMHGDIKLQNVLVDDHGRIRLCDFGHSRYMTDEECEKSTLRATRGTPAYACPEIMNGETYNGFDADAWAVGVVLYAIAFGVFPFPKAKRGVRQYEAFLHRVTKCDMEPTAALLEMWSHSIPRMGKIATLCFQQNLDQLLHPHPEQRIHF